MAEVLLLSLMSGSLGVSALLYYQWWSWQEQLSQQRNEEEEQLTTYPSKPEQQQVSPKLGMGIQNCAIAPQPISRSRCPAQSLPRGSPRGLDFI